MKRRMPSHMPRRHQRGFAYIAAVLILVVMASLSAAMVRLADVQQTTSAQDVLITRAGQAARAGVEWGLFRLANGGTGNCPATATTLTDFKAASGFVVTVTCTRSSDFREGEQADPASGSPVPTIKHLYRIDAVACNIGASCPNDAQVALDDYVERRRVATVCLTSTLTDCY